MKSVSLTKTSIVLGSLLILILSQANYKQSSFRTKSAISGKTELPFSHCILQSDADIDDDFDYDRLAQLHNSPLLLVFKDADRCKCQNPLFPSKGYSINTSHCISNRCFRIWKAAFSLACFFYLKHIWYSSRSHLVYLVQPQGNFFWLFDRRCKPVSRITFLKHLLQIQLWTKKRILLWQAFWSTCCF